MLLQCPTLLALLAPTLDNKVHFIGYAGWKRCCRHLDLLRLRRMLLRMCMLRSDGLKANSYLRLRPRLTLILLLLLVLLAARLRTLCMKVPVPRHERSAQSSR